MTLFAVLTFFMLMLLLAVLPSSSVALVVVRAASLGLANGVAAAGGIVIVDCLFLMLAIWGMSALASSFGAFFVVLKILAGAYLIWLGIQLWRSTQRLNVVNNDLRHRTLISSFLAGALLTLGDVKAILFYASLLPMLLDIQHLVATDITLLLVVTVVTVGGVKMIYAILARKIMAGLQQRQAVKYGHKIAGGVLVGAGTYLMVKT